MQDRDIKEETDGRRASQGVNSISHTWSCQAKSQRKSWIQERLAKTKYLVTNCLWQRERPHMWLQGYTSVNGGVDDRNMETRDAASFGVEDKK